MSYDHALQVRKGEILDELKQSFLILAEATVMNEAVLADTNAECNILFGTGLVAGKRLSQGLPFDFIGYLLAAERARQAFGLGGIVHLIADDYAKHEVPDQSSEVDALSRSIKTVSTKIAIKLGLAGVYSNVLSSEIHQSPVFDTLLDAAGDLEGLQMPLGSLNYVRTQLADMEYFRQHHRVRLKLSWVVKQKPLHKSKGFDERLFDNAYTQVFGELLSYVYTLSGRTFDPEKPRASPYVVTDTSSRVMLWPGEDVRAKLGKLLQRIGSTSKEAFEHMCSIVKELETLGTPIMHSSMEDKITGLAAVLDL